MPRDEGFTYNESSETLAELVLMHLNAAERNAKTLHLNAANGQSKQIKKKMQKLHDMLNDACLYADDVLIERRYKND